MTKCGVGGEGEGKDESGLWFENKLSSNCRKERREDIAGRGTS